MQRTNEASKPIHCPSSSTACSLPRISTILSKITLRRWLVSWKILYNRWLQHVWNIQQVQQSAAEYLNSSGGPGKREVHTSTFVFQKLVGCGCCGADPWEATQQTHATHHTHNTSAFMRELGREHLALSYRSVTGRTNIHRSSALKHPNAKCL